MRPALVVTNGTQSTAQSTRETMPKGAPPVWKRLGAAGVPVLAIRDNPRFVFAGPTCLARSGEGSERCSIPARRMLAKVSPFDASGLDNVRVADFTSWICPDGICSAAQNGVVVYRDDDHLARTFVLLNEPQISAALDAALDASSVDQPR